MPVRARYEESVAVFRSLGRDDDTSRALQWWGQWENNIGDHLNAAQRLLEAAQLTGSRRGVAIFNHRYRQRVLGSGRPNARRAVCPPSADTRDKGADTTSLRHLPSRIWRSLRAKRNRKPEHG